MRTLRPALAGAVNLVRDVMGAAAGTFTPTGSLAEGRCSHTATLLPDGRVLVVGGVSNENDSVQPPTAEVWNPTTGSFTPAGTLAEGCFHHTATLLPDGRVLIVGGVSNDSGRLATAEVWDPATASFIPAGSLTEGRDRHTATLLSDGRVLVVGGDSNNAGRLATAEVWDPATGSFTPAGTLTEKRDSHTATLLPDGRVLVVGGLEASLELLPTTAEVWDPATGSFTPAGRLDKARGADTATLLPDGRVLVLGGGYDSGDLAMVAEVWDPATGSFTPARTLAKWRDYLDGTFTLLPDGRVLCIGERVGRSFDIESDSWVPSATARVWDLATRTAAPAGMLAEGRTDHTATLLPDGRVLVVGGMDANIKFTATAEVWSPVE